MLTTLALAQTDLPGPVGPGETATVSADTPKTATDFSLGDCPDDLLRQAWLEEQPLQTAAVEAEVLALCTERSEAIADFLRTRAAQDAALGRLQGTQITGPTGTQTSPVFEDGQIETLRSEISHLQERIARLEDGPQQPETDERLNKLRAELAAVENDLALAEAAAGLAQPAQTEEADAEQIASAPEPSPEQTPDPETTGPEEEPTAQAESGPPTGDSTPAQTVPAPLSQPAPVWTVVHAVRRGDGPWQVRLSGTQDVAYQIPGLTENDPPRTEWRTEPLPPATLAVGEALSDGRVLKSVTSEGVTFANPNNPNAGTSFIAFASDGDTDPGVLEWKVVKIEEEGG